MRSKASGAKNATKAIKQSKAGRDAAPDIKSKAEMRSPSPPAFLASYLVFRLRLNIRLNMPCRHAFARLLFA
jgi:hypothetical protein